MSPWFMSPTTLILNIDSEKLYPLGLEICDFQNVTPRHLGLEIKQCMEKKWSRELQKLEGWTVKRIYAAGGIVWVLWMKEVCGGALDVRSLSFFSAAFHFSWSTCTFLVTRQIDGMGFHKIWKLPIIRNWPLLIWDKYVFNMLDPRILYAGALVCAQECIFLVNTDTV